MYTKRRVPPSEIRAGAKLAINKFQQSYHPNERNGLHAGPLGCYVFCGSLHMATFLYSNYVPLDSLPPATTSLCLAMVFLMSPQR